MYVYVWCGVVWCGVVWCGVVWCGVWCGVVWCVYVLQITCYCISKTAYAQNVALCAAYLISSIFLYTFIHKVYYLL